MIIRNTLYGPEEIHDTKICSDCGEEKYIEEFGTRAHRKDGTRETHNFCKGCNKIQVKVLTSAKKTIPKPDKNYKCPCCGKTEVEILSYFGSLQGKSKGSKRSLWTLDHDHKTLEIRNYVCLYCNDTLSRSGDSPTTLRGCANYLENFQERNNGFKTVY